MKQEEIYFSWDKGNFYIIWDNATIHKSKIIYNFLIENDTPLIKIPQYCPTLNAAEKVILSIK